MASLETVSAWLAAPSFLLALALAALCGGCLTLGYLVGKHKASIGRQELPLPPLEDIQSLAASQALRDLVGAINRTHDWQTGTAEVTRQAEKAVFLLEALHGQQPPSPDEPEVALDPLAVFDEAFALALPSLEDKQLSVSALVDDRLPLQLVAKARQLKFLCYHLLNDCMAVEPAEPRQGTVQVGLRLTATGALLGLQLSGAEIQPSHALLDLVAATGAQLDRQSLWLPVLPAQDSLPAMLALSPALLLLEDPGLEQALQARLERLGLQTRVQPGAGPLSCCFVQNPSSALFATASKQLPADAKVFLLGGRQALAHPEWLHLPWPVSQSQLQAQLSELVGTATPRQRALVVEDSEANRRLLAQQLAGLGHSVMQAETGEDALALAKLARYDLIFMDLQLPGMNGVETTRALRASGVSAPIYGLTAYLSDDDTADCLAAGMTYVLTKPLRQAQLRRLLGSPQGARRLPRAARVKQTLPPFDPGLALANANNNPSIAEELMTVFMDGLAEDQRLINQALGDKAALAAQVHRLHGAVRYCGVPRLQQVLEAMETALRQDDDALVEPLVNLLNAEVATLVAWYKGHPNIFAKRDSA